MLFEYAVVAASCFSCTTEVFHWPLLIYFLIYFKRIDAQLFKIVSVFLEIFIRDSIKAIDRLSHLQRYRRFVLAKLMLSMSAEEFSRKYTLIDCRYLYEYNGGHLRVSERSLSLFGALIFELSNNEDHSI